MAEADIAPPVPFLITTPDRIPAKRYYDEEFFQLENERLWPHVWQLAARLDAIPEIGDWTEYKILDKSVIVVRAKSGVKAFHNACRHRGVRLAKDHGNCRGQGFICPFHGWRWNMDGENTFVYGKHMFGQDQLDAEDLKLPQVRTEEWGDAHHIDAETSHSVFFQFGPLDAQNQQISLKTWGFTPTITADLGSGWQARVMGSYSRSDTRSIAENFNTAALANAISAGLFNPYDPAASDAAALAVIDDSELYSRTKQRLVDLKAVVDGELFQLPGGGVKVAVGAEIYRENYHIVTADQVSRSTPTSGSAAVSLPNALGVSTVIRPAIAPIVPIALKRTVKSVFGELVVPIFGADNATTMLEELTLSIAGRYDHYSDAGSTFNPKFGLTYRPVDWMKFRAAYGKSFNAPSLADAPGTVVSNISFSTRLPPTVLLAANGGPLPNTRPGSVAAFVQGNAAGIEPQKAKTLSIGLDIQPPFMPGFTFSTTFYKIDLKGVIRLPPTDAANVYGPYRSIVTFAGNQPGGSFTATDLANLLGSVTLVRNAPPGNIADLYAIIDLRKRNLENFKTEGLDFSGSYDIDTSFGSLNFAANANYELKRERQPAAGAAYVDETNVSMFRLRGSAGAQVGNLFGQVVWNHTAGFKLSPVVGFNGTTITGQSFTTQTRVGAFDVFNLFFRYDLKGSGIASDLQLTLNVDNVFNTAPPVYRGDPIANAYGYFGSLTLGRMVQFGISKKF